MSSWPKESCQEIASLYHHFEDYTSGSSVFSTQRNHLWQMTTDQDRVKRPKFYTASRTELHVISSTFLLQMLIKDLGFAYGGSKNFSRGLNSVLDSDQHGKQNMDFKLLGIDYIVSATMSCAIVAYLHQTQEIFTHYRLIWSVIISAIGANMSAGQSGVSYFLRIIGSFAALIICYAVWYIPDGKVP